MKRAVLIGAVAALCVAGSAVAQDRSGGLIGSGTRADSGQMMGSGNVTDQTPGSGGRAADDGQVLGSGGLIGSGTRAEDGGYLGSGLSVIKLQLPNGSSVLVVSSDEWMFVIPIEE